MKILTIMGIFAILGFLAPIDRPLAASISIQQKIFEHGGGCRRASLPQCCHMETRTGVVHCH
jgi:hypothetical protein